MLDAGAGEGYGGRLLLTAGASAVLATDLDAAALRHLQRAYPDQLAVRANLVDLPLRDASVDVIVSMQVLEHLWDQPTFLTECARVLRPGGRLLLSTPNALTFPRGNPRHPHEVDAVGLRALLRAWEVEELLGLHHGATLQAADVCHGGLVDAQLAGPPATWSAALRCDVTSVRTSDFVLQAGHLASSLDLLVAASRP